ncbi:MAG: head decoration protein [Collimonas sp.]|uniref:head decoration protein n=1 Tax=Collimonas sp. TaxID=1963772 RepID=UPI003266C779
MTTYTQRKTETDLLIVEVKVGWTKDRRVLAQSATPYVFGEVLAANAVGSLVQLAPAATDGTQTAVAILLEDVNATAADKPGTVVARGAVIDPAELVWPAGITAPQIAAALADLDKHMIITRAVGIL